MLNKTLIIIFWPILLKKQDKLAGPQDLAKRLDVGSNEAITFSKTPTLSLVLLMKDFFTKFIKVFVELI